MVKVKVCGLTRRADAEHACELGAAALGFVFWKGSPRYVTPADARVIVAGLPSNVIPVGVFVDAPANEIGTIASDVGLGAIQLHGDESVSFIGMLASRIGHHAHGHTDIDIMKAVSLHGAKSVDIALGLPEHVTVLVDVHDPVRKGGTGRAVDWTLAALVARRRRTFLAGGLGPGNIADAIATVSPYGVDVSSGLESAPGIKDAERMRDFFAEVARCEPPDDGQLGRLQR